MFLLNLLLFFVVIGLLVLVHEFGHFVVAKLLKVKVEEFGLGFPPRLASHQRHGTVYSLNWLPFGGFVKLKGEFAEAKDPESFNNAPVWVRILISIAGVAMNFLLAGALLFGGYLIGFSSYTQDLGQYPGAKIIREQVIVAGFSTDSAAEKAGVQAGDIVLAGDGQAISKITALQSFAKDHRGQTVTLDVSRSGEKKSVAVNLPAGKESPLGIAIAADQVVHLPFFQALKAATLEVVGMTKTIFWALVDLVKGIFTTGHVSEDVSGPVGIFQLTAAAARMGPATVLSLIIILSINLGLINILPFPALDGGRLFFLLTEALFRRRVIKEQVEAAITTAGFIFLLMLIVLLTYRDIARIS